MAKAAGGARGMLSRRQEREATAAVERAGFSAVHREGDVLVGEYETDQVNLQVRFDVKTGEWAITGSQEVDGELITDIDYGGKGTRTLLTEMADLGG